MSKTHPSNWSIKIASTEKHCQTVLLPLGPGAPSYRISVQLFNRVYKEWCSEHDTHHRSRRAGVFAQALRELRSSEIDLGSLPQVNTRSALDCYDWLSAYELKLAEFGIKAREEQKQAAAPEKIATGAIAIAEPFLYNQILAVAVKEYIIMAGPMGDAKQIAEKAHAVATACMGE